ncbi:hypothetical protein CYY_005266 [Polysphondylium violaceum]|uniref:JmjC domain-containing protein n=1 Tax=Polysphondylium violaceum TaxID=133409 RepID=A0A8J4PT81_9MYCE|nr:hypothetical protein CYY_005266 [Polysphondylium violaceum]
MNNDTTTPTTTININAFSTLYEEAKDFYIVENIERITKPTAIEFYREYVAQNRPVIITGVLDDIDAFKKWSTEYLRETLKDVEVTVAFTPDGFADAVKPIDPTDPSSQLVFVKPLEKKMKFQDYIALLENKDNKQQQDRIGYIQYQNDSFQIEYSPLWKDVNHNKIVDFAVEALGIDVDAINFWMGEDRSVSSLHKDSYENLYAVIRGTKTFHLLPPIDYPCLYEQEFDCATYVEQEDGTMKIEIDEPRCRVPWIPVDPTKPIHENIQLYPNIANAHVLEVKVEAGEILYLPSLYYHRVSQESNKTSDCIGTVAINYWFDMKYGLNYIYFEFLKQLTKDLNK